MEFSGFLVVGVVILLPLALAFIAVVALVSTGVTIALDRGLGRCERSRD